MCSRASFATRAVRAALQTDRQHGAVVPPLHLSTSFAFGGLGKKGSYDYTRSGNPTRDALAEALADLEGGAGAVVTSSGMAAVTLVVQLLRGGDLLLAPHDCYGGTFRLFEWLANRGDFDLRFVDQSDVDSLEALDRLPRLVWVETPSNPLLRITDIRCLRRRFPEAVLVVDNTFLSPLLQRPLTHGADLVLHSTTKYLNGHSDSVGGAVVAASPELHQELGGWANCLGLTGSPFDSYLTLRGLRTLEARMHIHHGNAIRLVALLESHSAVERVFHPSLATHPGHETAIRQQDGPGAMISFRLKGGVRSMACFLDGLEHFSLAVSLGGVESLVAHPASMTHAAMAPEARRRAGIDDSLVRLSVGIENGDDLAHDLTRALDGALRVARSGGDREAAFPSLAEASDR